MPRDGDDERIQMPLRLPKGLRRRLEAEAKVFGFTLNTVIVSILKGSLDDRERGLELYGDEETRVAVEVLLRILRALERREKKRFTKNPKILVEALRIYARSIELTPMLVGMAPTRTLRDRIDLAALEFIEEIVAGAAGLAAEEVGDDRLLDQMERLSANREPAQRGAHYAGQLRLLQEEFEQRPKLEKGSSPG
jgi:hypothetical protein